MPVSDFSYKQLLHDSVHHMINVLVQIRILTMFTGIVRVKRGGLLSGITFCFLTVVFSVVVARVDVFGFTVIRRSYLFSLFLSSDELSTLPSFSEVFLSILVALLETFRFWDENDYEYQISLKVFSRILK